MGRHLYGENRAYFCGTYGRRQLEGLTHHSVLAGLLDRLLGVDVQLYHTNMASCLLAWPVMMTMTMMMMMIVVVMMKDSRMGLPLRPRWTPPPSPRCTRAAAAGARSACQCSPRSSSGSRGTWSPPAARTNQHHARHDHFSSGTLRLRSQVIQAHGRSNDMRRLQAACRCNLISSSGSRGSWSPPAAGATHNPLAQTHARDDH
jgi:hypothetical protein